MLASPIRAAPKWSCFRAARMIFRRLRDFFATLSRANFHTFACNTFDGTHWSINKWLHVRRTPVNANASKRKRRFPLIPAHLSAGLLRGVRRRTSSKSRAHSVFLRCSMAMGGEVCSLPAMSSIRFKQAVCVSQPTPVLVCVLSVSMSWQAPCLLLSFLLDAE